MFVESDPPIQYRSFGSNVNLEFREDINLSVILNICLFVMKICGQKCFNDAALFGLYDSINWLIFFYIAGILGCFDLLIFLLIWLVLCFLLLSCFFLFPNFFYPFARIFMFQCTVLIGPFINSQLHFLCNNGKTWIPNACPTF